MWFLEEINTIDSKLARLGHEKSEKTQITKIRKDSRNVATNLREIKRIITQNIIVCQ